MAIIVIKDLPDSMELDRQAMLSIAGGARSRGQTPVFRRAHVHSAIVKHVLPHQPVGRLPPGDRQRLYPAYRRSPSTAG